MASLSGLTAGGIPGTQKPAEDPNKQEEPDLDAKTMQAGKEVMTVSADAVFEPVIWACKKYQRLKFEMPDGVENQFVAGRIVCNTPEEADAMDEAMANLARTSPAIRSEIVKVDRRAAE